MKTPAEYTSFPEASSPKPQIAGDIEKETGFFAEFSTHLADSSSNSIDLLKLLSDGIADLLFNGSNRLETGTEVMHNFPSISHGLFSSFQRMINRVCISFEPIKIYWRNFFHPMLDAHQYLKMKWNISLQTKR